MKTGPNGVQDNWLQTCHRLEIRSRRLERIAASCGVVVLLGMALESVPVILRLLARWSWQAFYEELLGSLLIALGIFFEILFALRGVRAQATLSSMKDERIAGLYLRAEQERLERLKLQMNLAGRHIAIQQTERMRMSLEAFPRQQVRLLPATADLEIQRFSSALWAALLACDWDARREDSRPQTAINAPGLHLLSTPDEPSQNAAAALNQAFLDAGIETRLHSRSSQAWVNDDRKYEKYFPPGLYNAGENFVLVIVNEAPLPRHPDEESYL